MLCLIYTHSPSGVVHICQAKHSCLCYNLCIYVCVYIYICMYVYVYMYIYIYIYILYFAWEDQSKKSALFIIKLQVCCMKNKAQ